MSIDVNDIKTGSRKSAQAFAYHFSSADANAGEEIIAAPGTGKRLIIEALMVMTDVAQGSEITVTFMSAADDNFGPLELSAESSPVVFPIQKPGVAMGVAEAFNITADAGDVSGFVQGYIRG